MTVEDKLISSTPEQYGGSHNEHMLEQYKLYVEMADRISHRRQNANGFGLSINTALLGIVGLVATRCTSTQLFVMVTVIAVTGLLMCYAWYRLVRSYRDLNTAKFLVIHAIEARLPIAPYAAEWQAAGEGKNAKLYKPFSHIEMWIPRIFMLAYLAAGAYGVVMLIVQGTQGGATPF